MDSKLSIYSPWIIYFKKMHVLFEKDPEIKLEFFDSVGADKEINLLVDNEKKAIALSKILPKSKTFGNITVRINVIPANEKEDKTKYKYVEAAFNGNGAFDHFRTVEVEDAYMSNLINYCVFKKEVVQYVSDDLGSEYGFTSTLYEDLARDILVDVDGVYFCTDIDKL